MTKICPHCGEPLGDDARFCGNCGEKLDFRSPTGSDTIFQDENGKYQWVYELPMLKSLFILVEVWKAFGMAAVLVLILGLLITLFSGDGIDSFLGLVMGMGIAFGIIFVLSFPAYLIVTHANNGKYTVLFEMDEDGINHTQIKTDKAKALDQLTMALGSRAGSYTTVGAGMLSASGSSLYSKFSNVKRIKGYPEKHLIRVNGRFIHNQVYAEGKDYDFVYKFIVSHCPQAKVD